ncbi:hypothetical protein FACS1894189_4970 [Planctomycetales bacterium]|nr:hypothetical protein FACS1894189_4970 [Planctomycetales bacterium]
MSTNRRQFLGLAAAAGASLAVRAETVHAVNNPTSVEEAETFDSLVDSPPVLQVPSNTGMTAVWAVKKNVTGYVQYGLEPEKLDQTSYGAVFGQSPFDDQFLQIRITGLKPNTKYYYRTATVPVQVNGASEFQSGTPVFGETYSFETAGSNKAIGSFSSINDMHENRSTLKQLVKRLDLIKSDYTVFNGDAVNHFDRTDQVVEKVLRPAQSAFATERPLIYVPGNHEQRGLWVKNVPRALPTWDRYEPENPSRGRNFVVRTGPLAMIGLDTGEDKEDTHQQYAGLAHYVLYRREQTVWLAEALESPLVKSAPFIVVFLHAPFDVRKPLGNDAEHPGWGELLNKYQVQLAVSGHTHRFAYFPAEPGRSWAQVVGGGNGPKSQVTVIHGKAEGDSLEVVVDELNKNEELGRWTYPKRSTV